MNKTELITRLAELPGEIEAQETKVINTYETVQAAKNLIVGVEDRLLIEGAIDGKNAETRAAQLRDKTFTERQNLQQCENQLSVAKATLNKLLNELATCRAIAGLLKAGE